MAASTHRQEPVPSRDSSYWISNVLFELTQCLVSELPIGCRRPCWVVRMQHVASMGVRGTTKCRPAGPIDPVPLCLAEDVLGSVTF